MQEASMSGIRLSLLSLLLLIAVRTQAAEPLVFRGKTLEQWRADLHSAHPEVRRRATMALGLSPSGNAAVPALLEAMKDTDKEVVTAARDALIQLGPTAPDAAPAIVPFIDSLPTLVFENGSVRVRATGRVRDLPVSALPLLLDRARRGDENLSGDFLNGVDRSAVPLLRAVLGDCSEKIRVAAADALGVLGKDAAAAVPELLAALKDDSFTVRAHALEALGSIGGRGDSTATIALLLHDDQPGPAVRALARMGPEGLHELRRAYHGCSEDLRTSILGYIYPAGPDALPLLFEGLGRHNRSGLRETAAIAIAASGAPVDHELPRLIAALADPCPQVRAAILSTLGEVVPPRPNVVLAIAQRLSEETPDVREKAAFALARLGRHARPAIPLLLEGLRRGDADLRKRVLGLLADITPPREEIVLALCDALRDDCAAIRDHAAVALGSFGPSVRAMTRTEGEQRREVVIPALRERLRDRDQCVRVVAAGSLLKIGYHSDELVQQLGHEVLDAWPRLFRASGHHYRDVAAGILQPLGPRAAPALPSLILALYDDDAVAIAPLGAMGPAARPAIPALERILDRSTEFDQFRKIALALIRIGGDGPGVVRERLDRHHEELTLGLLAGLKEAGPAAKEFRTEILRLTQHFSARVRTAAVDALGTISARREDVRNALLVALKDRSDIVQSAACGALGSMGPEARCAIPHLTALLIQSEASSRRSVVRALGRIAPEDRQAFPALVETLTDPDHDVRKAAVKALGNVGPVAAPALRSACRDRSEEVRVAAASALFRMKGHREEAGRVLRAVMLDAKEAADRYQACQALWKLERTREVVPVLCLLLRDDRYRSTAIETLCKLDGAQDDVRAFMKPLLRHELRAVRVAAWQVLDRIAPDLTDALADGRTMDPRR
jgi:HEAT repeat protein